MNMRNYLTRSLDALAAITTLSDSDEALKRALMPSTLAYGVIPHPLMFRNVMANPKTGKALIGDLLINQAASIFSPKSGKSSGLPVRTPPSTAAKPPAQRSKPAIEGERSIIDVTATPPAPGLIKQGTKATAGVLASGAAYTGIDAAIEYVRDDGDQPVADPPPPPTPPNRDVSQEEVASEPTSKRLPDNLDKEKDEEDDDVPVYKDDTDYSVVRNDDIDDVVPTRVVNTMRQPALVTTPVTGGFSLSEIDAYTSEMMLQRRDGDHILDQIEFAMGRYSLTWEKASDLVRQVNLNLFNPNVIRLVAAVSSFNSRGTLLVGAPRANRGV